MKHRNFKDVPMPDSIAALPRDGRGYPIPFVVLIDATGKPQFKINERHKRQECIDRNLCHICGTVITDGDMWITGGPLSAFHPDGSFVDGPTHYECIRYALSVCPYLAFTQYDTKKEEEDLNSLRKIELGAETVIVHDPTLTLDRVPFFVASKILGYHLLDTGTFRPFKPYTEQQYWKDGQQITVEQARTLLQGYELFWQYFRVEVTDKIMKP